MPKVKMTSAYIVGALVSEGVIGNAQGFGGTNTDDGANLVVTGRANRLVLFKGVPPTLADMKLSTYSPSVSTGGLFRASDRLVSFNYGNLYTGLDDGAFSFKETTFHTAIASGQATWFAMVAWNSGTSYCSIIGDVSDLNGDGIIKLPNVNIVSGDRYLMNQIKLRFPMEFEY